MYDEAKRSRVITYLRVRGVRACFSYRQCRLYLMHRSHVGRSLLQRALRLRHSLQAWSEDPMKDMSNRGSSSAAGTADGSVLSAGGLPSPARMMDMMKGDVLLLRADEVDCHLETRRRMRVFRPATGMVRCMCGVRRRKRSWVQGRSHCGFFNDFSTILASSL